LILLLTSSVGLAADDRSAQVEQRMAEARARLNLSDEQVDQMTPVLEQSAAEQRAIMESYGVDMDNPGAQVQKLGFRQARSMRGEMNAVRADTRQELEGILTDEQLDEFARMQEERQAEMRERIQAGR
jgi:hypothetical protein